MKTHKRHIVNALTGILIVVFTFNGFAQTCLQKLDSVYLYKYESPEKARFYASALLEDLDSGRCVTELGIAALYNNIGLSLWEINEKKKGLDALKRGLNEELKTKPETHPDLLGLYYNLTTFYRESANFVEAESYLNKAESVINRHFANDKEKQVGFLFNKGVYYREKGDFQKSIEALETAISKINLAADSTQIALQIELGTTYINSGDMAKSELILIEAIEAAEGNQERLLLKAIDRLSALMIELGDFSDSETYLLENLQRKDSLYSDAPLLKLETYNNLSILYYRLNDLASAEKYIARGLDENQNIRTVKPKLLNNLGTIYMKEGNLEEAEKYFNESAKAFQEIYGSINPDYATSLSNLAGIYKLRGELKRALDTYSKVLDMDRAIYGTKHPTYATSLSNVGLLYMQFGSMGMAKRLLNQAKEIRFNSLGGYHPLYIKTVNDLAIYHLIEKDTVAAMDAFDHALDAEIHHMHDIFPVLTDKQRKLYFNETRSNIERYCALAFQPSFVHTPYAVHAVNHFINTKGMLFYASEKMRRVILGSGDEKIINTYNTWREEKYLLAQAYLLTQDERERQGLDIQEMETYCIDLEKELAQTFHVFLEEERSAYHTWEEISNVLGDSTAMIDMIQFRNYHAKIVDQELDQGFEDQAHYVAFIIKQDSVIEAVTWDRDIDFEKGLKLYNNAIKFGIKDKLTHKIFWAPIQAHLNDINRVYFSPDGIYHKLNPAILFDIERQKYVADEIDITNITSGKDLIYAEDKQLIREAKIVGNPDFSNVQTEYMQLKQLAGAEEEAKDITRILDVRKWNTESFYFAEATEDQIKTFQNPGVIHIATHGFFKDDPDNVDPLHSSGIFLSKQEGSSSDGILTAYEAMNLQLDQTSLVVLAACETGLGTVKNGEGVFGLQRAFLVAGADNVLISLVKINDQAARRFMNLLYEQLRDTEDPQQAFFNARALYRQEDENPYNWGAYILVTKG
ncbi:MAG: CHAT domain-containing protein [Reichenbachiella sp.]|uniref:CHAT domain-containing protein n=1 Tax=Reichenbachiella sp. TaxID=2184521 RepID=UPI002967657B|nr:CHAT domain-containing protein [Reichenbachiella sp.]MDW3210646.1 CHAT domain-containing protein [Reichenbachiella sp.]